MSQKQQKIANRVLGRVLDGSSGTQLAAVFREASSKSKKAMSELEDIVDKAIELIEESEEKDHIYSKAGDMISRTPDLLDEINKGLDIISYTSSRIDQKKLKNKVPADTKQYIDKVIKRDT